MVIYCKWYHFNVLFRYCNCVCTSDLLQPFFDTVKRMRSIWLIYTDFTELLILFNSFIFDHVSFFPE